MALKVVFFFNAAQEGWTETYYAVGSDPKTWAQTNLTFANLSPFINIRAGFVSFFEARVSLIGSPRKTYSLVGTQLPPNPSAAFTNSPPDVTAEDALCVLTSATGINRHLWVRGLVESEVVFDQAGTPTPPPLLLVELDAMFQSMVRMGLSIQNAVIPTPSSGAWFSVVSMAPSASLVPSTVLTAGPSWTPSLPYPPLYFQGIDKNMTPGFPRQLLPLFVTNISGSLEVTVPWLYRAASNPYSPKKMKFTPLVESYNPITSLTFERYGTRKTGRPFGVPRGRAAVAVKRQ